MWDFRFSLTETLFLYTCPKGSRIGEKRESIFNTLLRIRSEEKKGVCVYSTTDDVFAWSKLVWNCFCSNEKKDQMEFFLLFLSFMKTISRSCDLSVLLLVYRDANDDDGGWNTPCTFIHIRHVTNRLKTTVAMSIWHCPFVRVFSDDTWELNIRLLLIIIVRPYWLLSLFFLFLHLSLFLVMLFLLR